MGFSALSKGSPAKPTGSVETVIAVGMDKNSQSAFKWAVDNLLKESPNCVIVYVKTQQPLHPNDPSFVPKEGRPPTDEEHRELFLHFRGYYARKGIYAKELVLQDVNVANAISSYVIGNSIINVVIGASTKNALLRKFSSDTGKVLLKSLPDWCSVYIVGKEKLHAVRLARKTVSQSTHSSASISSSNSSTPTKTIPTSGFQNSPPHTDIADTYDVTSTYSFRSQLSASSGSPLINSPMQPGLYNRLNIGSPLLTKPVETYLSKSSFAGSASELSEFSPPVSYQSSNMSSYLASSASEHSHPSLSYQATGHIESEIEKLQLELKQSMSDYHTACQYAANAERKDIERVKGSNYRSIDKPPKEAPWSSEKPKKRDNYGASASSRRMEPVPSLKKVDVCYRRYSIQQIEEATDNFSSSRKVGEGGYGPVYLGTLDHTQVAIKALKSNVSQGLKQFHQEIEVLSRMRHPSMVILVGACPEYGCLVYEYMDNGNLEERLFCKDGTPPIPWQTRFKIAAEIATGLAFLHHTKPEPVVHRDIKPSNILLDRNYTSKISDVGLARLVPASVANPMTHCHMTAAAGTFCYIDPEYQQTGMLGVKSDVYSFGVLLLQLITARQAMGLAMQVEDAIEEDMFPAVLDPAVTDWPLEDTLSLAKLALRCCELRRKDRPDLASEILPELIRLRDLGAETTKNAAPITKRHGHDVIDLEIS